MFCMKLFVFVALVLTSCVANPAFKELSEEEDLELERQLKVMNKSPVKTIETEDGHIYDCIDFYKQPAFDHALLKNHDFHPDMKPSKVNRPQKVENEEESRDNKTKSVTLKGIGCPRGTVPIRRTTKEDLIRLKTFNEMFDSNIHPQTNSEPGLHYAGGRVRPEWIKKHIGGADGHFALYKTPYVNQLQFSSGLIKVSNGSDFIKAGWTVNPTLYGDNRCRFFAYLHTREQHCFNTNCPGFVIVNTDIPLDYAFPEVSLTGVHMVEARFYIFRDPLNGNWWLNIGDKEKTIGFWPSRIFTDLAYNADDVFWGGEIFTIPNSKSSPMGNGLKIVYDDPKLYAYARDVSIVDADSQKIIGVAGANEVISDIGWDYVRQNYFYVNKYWGRTIMFGGPARIFGK
ncbi:unnamed protein product [Arabidopsis lyrata]|uniref:Neprosin PEP catalytic domain-containing protein n=2 Tax=Arabidopsis lyrata subsp. lyrata TaxID=81972 RepID=D7M095_ARALL|nr:uncharacterized protein LOC9308687 isoform X1 [Arabidopsis lyrata subsp. lyrata]EFH48877.1 hypothetical protein ARALYDRAFT_352255 [Arabidopsis lyrata subsp. lyrata]CAH8273016.1 unnamed protein product [Arabidopsis lyrata]|eukprot:XP_002872618.1 uncharacterized protein LOC9308687 isoform X1 [Arabidopsis lyrata subsp. lyrata]